MQTSLRALLLAGLVVVDLATRFQGLTPRISADFYTPPPAARQLASTNFRVRLYNDKDWMRFFKRSKQPPSPRPAGPWIARNSLLPMSASTWGLSSAIDPDIVEVFLLPSRQFTELFLAFRLMNRPERTALLLRMAGVTHVASERVIDLNSVDPRSAEPIALTAINAPPLYFAGEIVQARNAFAMRDVLLSARPLTNPAFIEQNAFAPAPGRVLGFAQTANTITADVESEGRAFLVFTTTAHRYWRATIDDRETPIEPTNIAFQGVVVPPGRHRIALRYSNPVVIVCGIISIIAIAALAAMIAWPLRSRESPPPSPH
jgi:hypothetical protein